MRLSTIFVILLLKHLQEPGNAGILTTVEILKIWVRKLLSPDSVGRFGTVHIESNNTLKNSTLAWFTHWATVHDYHQPSRFVESSSCCGIQDQVRSLKTLLKKPHTIVWETSRFNITPDMTRAQDKNNTSKTGKINRYGDYKLAWGTFQKSHRLYSRIVKKTFH